MKRGRINVFMVLEFNISLSETSIFSFLADPRDSETVRPVDFHHGMEVRLGMSKGPVAPSFI